MKQEKVTVEIGTVVEAIEKELRNNANTFI